MAMAAIPIALMAGGSYVQMMAGQQQAKSEETLAKYQAELAKRDAAQERSTGAEEQRLKRAEMRKALARNREITASSGFMMSGTPAAKQLELIDNYGYDIARTGYESESRAVRYDTQGQLYKMKAKSARRAGRIGTWSALFGGATDIFSHAISGNQYA